jgi:cytochrome c oxidase subunit 2
MVVKVTGRQWAWEFEYPNGKKTVGNLYLALDRPVRLEIRSADVIHGFYVPAFRIKMDAVPGRANYTWFQPTQLGSFDIECTVICGVDHYKMLAKAVVVQEDEFTGWLLGGEDAPPPGHPLTASADSPKPVDAPALAILRDRKCLTCHSVDGQEVKVGPAFKGAFGTKATVIAGGVEREVLVDEEYLKKAIQDPLAEITKGYPPAMPKLSEPLSDAELDEIINYIKSLN